MWQEAEQGTLAAGLTGLEERTARGAWTGPAKTENSNLSAVPTPGESPASSEKRALEYLRKLGLWYDGVKFSVPDVLGAFSMAERCRECREEEFNVKKCRYHGYQPVLCLGFGDRISLAMRKCERLEEAERMAVLTDLAESLPIELRYCSLRTFVADESVSESVRAAARKTREAIAQTKSLFLGGDVGVGKTHLAASIVVDSLLSGMTGMLISVPLLMNRLKSFGPKGDYDKTLDAVCRCDVLALDDLGVENCTPWAAEQLYIVVNERYLHKRQTLITTNYLTPDALLESMGEGGMRIVSRLLSMGDWVSIEGDDYRLSRRKAKGRK
jgi:DNA replication protein DnaC